MGLYEVGIVHYIVIFPIAILPCGGRRGGVLGRGALKKNQFNSFSRNKTIWFCGNFDTFISMPMMS